MRERVGRGITPAFLYRLFSFILRVKDSLSRLFARCGCVQSVDICEKPGEKKEKLTSKFFNCKTVTVKLGGGEGEILMLQYSVVRKDRKH